ncbi:MAG: endonuclease V [Gemmatimonas sp. SG8_28]|jgi:deoxyribonuclease V|nr:MAG: endonuclease V [Gemmatimonas sp. SG8_28]
MRILPVPHRWAVTPKQAVDIQQRLAAMVRLRPPPKRIRLVAGVDAAFSRDGTRCIAAAVVWDVDVGSAVEQRLAIRPVRFPYIPGLLSFREAPAIIAALRRLRCEPDAIMCDAHGLAHPRRFGLACHVGVLCDRPTIGCAKSVLVGEFTGPKPERGSRTALRDRGERIGTVLRSRSGVKPVFVSAGHRIDLRTAERIVLACATGYRLPEPTRRADRVVSASRATG